MDKREEAFKFSLFILSAVVNVSRLKVRQKIAYKLKLSKRLTNTCFMIFLTEMVESEGRGNREKMEQILFALKLNRLTAGKTKGYLFQIH